MENELTIFPIFKYFVECYFHQDVHYKDIEKVSIEFITLETQEHTEKLLKELNKIIAIDNWEFTGGFIRRYGCGRNLNHEELKSMVETMIRVLSENKKR